MSTVLHHDLFDPPRETEHDRNRLYGVFPAVVTNNADPEGLHRVRLRFPHLPGENESNWARVATPMAGKDRGVFCLPEVDDEVLVMFEHGDVHHPFVVGQMWNGRDVAPHDNADGKNNLRFFRSRNGHRVIFDDTDGAEKIVISEKSGKNRIVIDAVANSVQVISEGGTINIKAPAGLIRTNSTSTLIHASDKLEIIAGGKFDTKVSGATSVSGGSMLEIMSGKTEFNPSSGGGGGGGAGVALTGDDLISTLTTGQQGEAGAGAGGAGGDGAGGEGGDGAGGEGTEGGDSGETTPTDTATTTPGQEHLIEVQVVNSLGNPMANVFYELKLPDGSTRAGTTGSDGFVRQSVVPQTGDFVVRLPDHEPPEESS